MELETVQESLLIRCWNSFQLMGDLYDRGEHNTAAYILKRYPIRTYCKIGMDDLNCS